ncbi:MAG: hypothetical protein ACE5H2_08375 [Terriglobia bacterium]
MSKLRFVNQKLGKRISRVRALGRRQLQAMQPPAGSAGRRRRREGAR